MSKEKIYFIAVIPDNTLQDKVTDIKKYVAENFNSKHGLKSPPHITLKAPFKWQEDEENAIEEALESFSKGRKSFEVKLRGFDAFRPRVIFIHIEENPEFEVFFEELIDHIKENLKLSCSEDLSRPYTPHMTIAHKDLTKEYFYNAWRYFKDKAFDEQFEVKSIFLLKHNGKWWDVKREIKFQ